MVVGMEPNRGRRSGRGPLSHTSGLKGVEQVEGGSKEAASPSWGTELSQLKVNSLHTAHPPQVWGQA